MYTLLILFLLSGVCGIAISFMTNIVIGYIAYGALIIGFTALLLGVSALISYFMPTTSTTKSYQVLQVNDDDILIRFDATHNMLIPKSLLTNTIHKSNNIPILEITTVSFKHQSLERWFIPINLQPDKWILYI